MRKELKKLDGQRLRFRAKVERFGEKNGYMGTLPTILLTNVFELTSGQVVTDHLWFTRGKTWQCEVGDIVEFDARVGSYEKGYKGYRKDVCKEVKTDYRLERPTKFCVIN